MVGDELRTASSLSAKSTPDPPGNHSRPQGVIPLGRAGARREIRLAPSPDREVVKSEEISIWPSPAVAKSPVSE